MRNQMKNQIVKTNITTSETPDPGQAPPNNQVSPRQLAANRANCQKSTGPKTPAGKARVRFNSLKHGLTATQVCLPGESRAEYDQRRQEYVDHFQPANLIEWDILDDLFAARWRKERSIKYEKCLLLDTFTRRRLDIEKDYESISLDAEAALAFHELSADSHFLKLLDRYETRVMHNILADWKLLEEARQNRPPASDSPALTTSGPIASPLRSKTIPENEHLENEPAIPELPETPDPEPIGNATQPMTIVRRIPARTDFGNHPTQIADTTKAPLLCTAST
jgi:hypothetical protein